MNIRRAQLERSGDDDLEEVCDLLRERGFDERGDIANVLYLFLEYSEAFRGDIDFARGNSGHVFYVLIEFPCPLQAPVGREKELGDKLKALEILEGFQCFLLLWISDDDLDFLSGLLDDRHLRVSCPLLVHEFQGIGVYGCVVRIQIRDAVLLREDFDGILFFFCLDLGEFLLLLVFFKGNHK